MSKINLARPAHIYYRYQNLEKAHAFLLDFGFFEVQRSESHVYYGGYGSEPFIFYAERADEDEFGGAAFAVDSIKDLERATSLPGATQIHELESPGGGKRVTLRDPVDGHPYHFVYGQIQVSNCAAKEHHGTQPFNYPHVKNRPAGRFQRFEKGPSAIHKLGHFGMCTTDFNKSLKFFTENFNFVPSDLIHDESGNDVATFLHLDRGKEMVDHHSFFFYQGPNSHVHHSSFEVYDFDTQLLGHNWLREQGYKVCWGVGRHLLGSQFFDYW